MSEIIPEAYCDALMIFKSSPKSLLPMSTVEMHLFSYLGRVLALFQGKAIGEWGYQYAVTTEGFPFSGEFEDAKNGLISLGLIDVDDDGFMLPVHPQLEKELELVLTLGDWNERLPWMEAATSCALALPMGAIRYAIGQSPGVANSLALRQRRALLEEDDVHNLYEEYDVVRGAMNLSENDLLSPAVIWLSARILKNRN